MECTEFKWKFKFLNNGRSTRGARDQKAAEFVVFSLAIFMKTRTSMSFGNSQTSEEEYATY